MAVPKRPPLDTLRRRLRDQRTAPSPTDGFVRETFRLPRSEARAKARELLDRFPRAAYWTQVESWREWPGGEIEFTMRRLRSAD